MGNIWSKFCSHHLSGTRSRELSAKRGSTIHILKLYICQKEKYYRKIFGFWHVHLEEVLSLVVKVKEYETKVEEF